MRALFLALCLPACAAPPGEPAAAREVLHASAPIEGTRLAHGPVVERWSRLPSGLEHTFELPDRASVPGAFRFEPPGATFLGADARGVRYRTSQGTFWYSHGQLIDATGARTHVPARWNQGAIELAITNELAARTQYPAVLDPSLGPEREIAPPLARPALRVERSAVAFGPRGGIVVWLDADADTPRARATALDVDGRPRELTYDLGMAWEVHDLAVAAGADGFVTAWSTSESTRVLRLADDGRPTSSDYSLPGRFCDIAATDRGYLLVTGEPTALSLYEIDSTGAPATRRVLAGVADYPRVACAEAVCLVVWSDRATRALRVTPTGRVLDAAPFLLDERAARTGVAGDGERFLVGWRDGWQVVHGDGALGARGVVQDAETGVFGAPGVFWHAGGALFVGGSATRSSTVLAAAAAWTGARWVVVPGRISRVVTYDRELGDQRDAGDILRDAPQSSPSVVRFGTEYLVVWAEQEVWRAKRVDARGVPRGEAVEWTGGFGSRVVAASVGDGAMMLVDDPTAGVRAHPVSPDARLGPGVTLEARSPNVMQLACGSSACLVELGLASSVWVWRRFLRVDASTFEVATLAQMPAPGVLAAAHAFFAVLRTRYDLATHESVLEVQRLRGDGSLQDVIPVEAVRRRGPIENVRATPIAAGLLVAWCENIGERPCFAKLIPASGAIATDAAALPMTQVSLVAGAADGALVQGFATASFPETNLVLQQLSDVATPVGSPLVFPELDSGRRLAIERGMGAQSASSGLVASGIVENLDLQRVLVRSIGPVRARGETCEWDAECTTGFCVDSVCCESACDRDMPRCRACSLAMGGAVDGQCTLRADGVPCREAASACDAEEVCDGVSTACPADAPASAGTVCRPAAGVCDADDLCDGASLECPADSVLVSGTPCRAAAGECDAPEACDGAGALCPPDDALRGTVCRAANGPCDLDELCDGVRDECPADAWAPDGTVCADGLACNGEEACVAGSCVSSAPPACDDGDACTIDSCSDEGGCTSVPDPRCCRADAECNDGDACTSDVCQGARCAHARTCCDGDLECDDGDPCTIDSCASGACEHAPACADVDSGVPGEPAGGGCECRATPGVPATSIAILLPLLMVIRRRR